MYKPLSGAIGILAVAALLSCNDQPCKLSASDSENVAASWIRLHPKAFHADKFDSSLLTNSPDQKHTKPITLDEAREYVRSYTTARLPGLQVRDPHGPDFIPIKAFELDRNILDTCRKYDTIWGLRVYLGRRPDSEYTLVIIPKNKAQENILDKPWLFDWNNPCPPYCPPRAEQFPD